MKDEIKTNPSYDLISRADAIEAIASAEPKDNEYHYYKHIAIKILSEIPSIEVEQTQAEKCDECIHKGTRKDKMTCKECTSIEANNDDLIIKRAKGIQDGLYNIKDGKLFQYKAKGGTVQSYEIVPSTESKTGEWVSNNDGSWNCSECGLRVFIYAKGNYCPNCGAKMKGASHETNKR